VSEWLEAVRLTTDRLDLADRVGLADSQVSCTLDGDAMRKLSRLLQHMAAMLDFYEEYVRTYASLTKFQRAYVAVRVPAVDVGRVRENTANALFGQSKEEA